MKSLIYIIGGVLLLAGCRSYDSQHVAWANRIFEAGETKTPIAPLTLERDISVNESYEVQTAYNELMQRSFGKPTGYKVAYASKSSQEKWNISDPTFGMLFEKQRTEDGGSIRADEFITFYNEAEVAFTIGQDIHYPLGSVEELMPYLKSVHAGFDVPNQRFDAAKGSILVADVIAMSCASHAYVIGAAAHPASIDYTNSSVELTYNDRCVYAGNASNVMGDPREAVLVLVKHLIDQGSYLKKGDVVLSGAVAPAYSPKTIDATRGLYVGTVAGLPPVTLIVR